MKIICYIYDSLKNPVLGGGGVYRDVYLHKELASAHDITFYSGHFKGAKEYQEHGMRFRFLGFGRNYYISRITYSLFATIHSLFAGADLYVVSYSIYSPVLTFIFKPRKTVIQFYHFTGVNVFTKYGAFGIFPFLAEKVVMWFGRYFITLAQGIAESIKQESGKEALPTYIGIDESLRYEGTSSENFLLSFGRIDVRMKGLDVLFDIFEKIAESDQELRLVIAGRGVTRDIEYVTQRLQSSPFVSRIEFINDPDQAKKVALLRSARVVVIPSRFEGWNIVATEAAASSRPVVGSRIPGLLEAIKDNETGFLCESENVGSFELRIKQLLADSKLREEMGRNGYQWAMKFEWKRIAEMQNKFYIDVLGRAKR